MFNTFARVIISIQKNIKLPPLQVTILGKKSKLFRRASKDIHVLIETHFEVLEVFQSSRNHSWIENNIVSPSFQRLNS